MGSLIRLAALIARIRAQDTFDSDDLNVDFATEQQALGVDNTNVVCDPKLFPPVELVRYDNCESGTEFKPILTFRTLRTLFRTLEHCVKLCDKEHLTMGINAFIPVSRSRMQAGLYTAQLPTWTLHATAPMTWGTLTSDPFVDGSSQIHHPAPPKQT